jgi:hypothetical protein
MDPRIPLCVGFGLATTAWRLVRWANAEIPVDFDELLCDNAPPTPTAQPTRAVQRTPSAPLEEPLDQPRKPGGLRERFRERARPAQVADWAPSRP